MIIESLMPIDYYSNMVGALIDQRVFVGLLCDKMPDLVEHLESLFFDPSLISFQWFACLFSYNMPLEVINFNQFRL